MASGARVAVLGGGVAGLVAARQLAPRNDVTLFEAAPHPGGKLVTVAFRGRPLDPGPDAFIRRNPAGVALALELGLGGELIEPAARGRGARHARRTASSPREAGDRHPDGPPGAVVLTGALTAGDVARRGRSPPRPVALAAGARAWCADPAGDPSVGEVIAPRLGRAVLDGLVDPLVGGINASNVDSLSFAAALPQLVPLVNNSSSLMRALRPLASPGAGPGTPSLFAGLEGGLARLATALVDEARRLGVELALGGRCAPSPPSGRGAAGGWTPSQQAASSTPSCSPFPPRRRRRCSRTGAPELAEGLRAIPYAGVVTTTLALPESAVPQRLSSELARLCDRPRGEVALPGAGVLVGRASGTLATAISFTSTKWPRSACAGEVVLRISAGRHGDARALELDDEALRARLGEELEKLLGIGEEPLDSLIRRFPGSFPQYVRGHLERVRELRSAARALPPIVLAGAAYDGIGIPACIAGGTAAATALRAALTS